MVYNNAKIVNIDVNLQALVSLSDLKAVFLSAASPKAASVRRERWKTMEDNVRSSITIMYNIGIL